MLRYLAPSASALLALALWTACSKTPPELASSGEAGPAATPSAGPVVMAKIGTADCEKWAEHDVKVVLADWRDTTSNCAAGVRDAIREKVDKQKADIKTGAVAACTRHLGEDYSSADSGCYMAATTVKGLANCRFLPMAIPEDNDLPSQLDRLRASCAPPAPAPSH